MARAYQVHPFLPQPYAANVAGVYAIVNRVNGKLYVGSGVNLRHRWSEHRHDLAKGKHHSPYLQRAFNKTPEAFYIEVIEETPTADRKSLLRREQFWIDFFKAHLAECGYNICSKAQSCQGVQRSPEFKAKMRVASSGAWSEERKARWKIIRSQTQPKGWKWTEKQRANHSEIHKGKKWRLGQKEKMLASIEKSRNPFNRKKLIQLTKDGREIRRFISVSEAMQTLGVIDKGNITNVCRGKRRTAFGFLWKYG